LKHCLKCNEINNNSSLNCANCSSPINELEKLEDNLRPEDRQRFKFIGFAGEGSFGKVYRCQDIKLQKLVALKLIKSECLGNDLFLDLFKRECEFSKNIGEEHLVSTLDYFVADGYAYSVMEFIEGIELSAYIRQKKALKLEEFKKIAVQIASGLHFFHYHGLLHCDLKPSNIMINPSTLKLKLVDFGLSHFKFEENILDKDMVGGTRGYMSPEQESGVKALTAASDIYSVGVIYYETLTGARPEYDKSGELIPPSAFCDVLIAAAEENYFDNEDVDTERLSYEVVNIVDYIDMLIARCLQKEPRGRFKTIEELKAVIEKAGHDFKLDIVIEKTAVNYEIETAAEPAPDAGSKTAAADAGRQIAAVIEGSAVKKIKHSTIMTKILAEPEESKTSKTLLLKYNKPQAARNAGGKAGDDSKKAAGAQVKPPIKTVIDDRPRKKGTVYRGEEKPDTEFAQYIVAVIIVFGAIAAGFVIYWKYF